MPPALIVTVVTIAGIFAVVRFFVPSRKPDFGWPGWYKTLAHMLIGCLAGLAIGKSDWWIPVGIAVGLTGVEIVAFLTVRHA